MPIDIFTTPGPGTYVVPPFVTQLTVRLWGAGGAGGDAGGGGGGGGGYSEEVWTVTPSQTIDYWVGTGGPQSTSGEATTFGDGAEQQAEGGDPGHGAGGGDGGNDNLGDTVFTGGTGGFDAGATVGGGGGSSAGPTSNGNNGSTGTGGAGSAAPNLRGAGGDGATGTANGTTGSAPGGGGGGGGPDGDAVTDGLGGHGADGRIEIEYAGLVGPPEQERRELLLKPKNPLRKTLRSRLRQLPVLWPTPEPPPPPADDLLFAPAVRGRVKRVKRQTTRPRPVTFLPVLESVPLPQSTPALTTHLSPLAPRQARRRLLRPDRFAALIAPAATPLDAVLLVRLRPKKVRHSSFVIRHSLLAALSRFSPAVVGGVPGCLHIDDYAKWQCVVSDAAKWEVTIDDSTC